jgi:hypothetical protein
LLYLGIIIIVLLLAGVGIFKVYPNMKKHQTVTKTETEKEARERYEREQIELALIKQKAMRDKTSGGISPPRAPTQIAVPKPETKIQSVAPAGASTSAQTAKKAWSSQDLAAWNKQVTDYIKSLRSKGYSDAAIFDHLKKHGYSEDYLRRIFK